MSQKEKGAVIAIFAVLFAGLFYYFTKADLKTLVRNLDQFRPPKKIRENKAHKREPLVTIIGQGQVAVAPLVAVLTNDKRPPQAKIGAAIALGRLKAEEAADPLAKLLDVEEKELNRFAAVALLKVGREGQEAIGRYLKSNPPAKGKITAMYALRLWGNDARAITLIGETVRSEKDPTVREAAVVELQEVPGKLAAQLMAVATQDTNEKVRFAAEHGLGRRNDKELLGAARALVQENDKPELRKLAMLLVRNLHKPVAYQVLKTGFEDDSLMVSSTAAPGYGRWIKEYPDDRKTFVTRLTSLLKQATDRQQLLDLGQAAANAKVTELTDFFMNWLAGGKTNQRLSACKALSEIGTKMNTGQIATHMDDPDKDISTAVHTCAVRLLKRAKKSQPSLHFWVGRKEPPRQKQWWADWWKKQQEIYKLSDESDEMCRLAREKIKTLKTPEMRKAKKLLEDAREKLLKMAELTGQEPTRRIQNIQKEIATVIYHSSAK